MKAPGFGIAAKRARISYLTGGKYVTEDLGLKLENTTIDMLGRAAKVKVNKEETIIVNGYGAEENIKKRLTMIKNQFEEVTSEYDREKLQERMARLAGGVAVIQVGAATETELKEKKPRMEDALSATRAAVEEGIVAGGGTLLLDILPALEEVEADGDELTGVKIVKKALEEPVRQMCQQCGCRRLRSGRKKLK